MRKNKCYLMVLLISIIILVSGCKQISEQEAILIAQNFVNVNVKFYVDDDINKSPDREDIIIDILDTRKERKEWNIALYAQSDIEGEIKKSGLIVVVDAKTGEVKREKVRPFKIGE